MKTSHFPPERARFDSLDEFGIVCEMQNAYRALLARGWQDALYAPKDRSRFLAIEAGSVGIHVCIRDNAWRFWIIARGDLVPSHPILFKPMPPEDE